MIIGVAGQCQNGKDTLADRLYRSMDQTKWKRGALAKNVKKVFVDAFGTDYEFIEEWKVKPEPPPGFSLNVRKSLQYIGDGFRQIKPTIWVDLCFSDKTPRILADIRYPNEWRRIRKEGGLNILVARREKLNDDPNGSEAELRPYAEWFLNNTTENVVFPKDLNCEKPLTDIDMFDIFVRNDGTIEDLYCSVDNIVFPFVNSYFGDKS